ncbi:AAA family ATPase [Paenibacillus sp. UNCCL117]|uniref:AAA family ATPase n=1 Tax=Paenibacillus sp. UNCCL117 TaxID=1502764 RepID=UPI001C40A7C8|nr:AAA family ATPase [Paenibacillus sp. UNCCL117]
MNTGLILVLNKGLNVLIGENDAGKWTVIDSIKFVLLTQSRDILDSEKKTDLLGLFKMNQSI